MSRARYPWSRQFGKIESEFPRRKRKRKSRVSKRQLLKRHLKTSFLFTIFNRVSRTGANSARKSASSAPGLFLLVLTPTPSHPPSTRSRFPFQCGPSIFRARISHYFLDEAQRPSVLTLASRFVPVEINIPRICIPVRRRARQEVGVPGEAAGDSGSISSKARLPGNVPACPSGS